VRTLPRARCRETLATCCAAHTLHDGLSDVSYVLLPILAQAFNLSLAQVGLIRSAWRAATAIFQTPVGLIAERLGARNLLAFCTSCAGLAFIALGQAAGFAAILISLPCAGFGSVSTPAVLDADFARLSGQRPCRALDLQFFR
jgi:MFS family permease